MPMTCLSLYGFVLWSFQPENASRRTEDTRILQSAGRETDTPLISIPTRLLLRLWRIFPIRKENSDGVTEATNSDEELLGEERMLVAMNRSKDLSPEETIASIRKAIDIFVDGAEQFDDITILAFKYYGPQ